MTAGSTIRTHLEQQVAELDHWLAADRVGHLELLRLLREHAVEMLRILDEATPAKQLGGIWADEVEGYVVILDPVGVRDAKEPEAP